MESKNKKSKPAVQVPKVIQINQRTLLVLDIDRTLLLRGTVKTDEEARQLASELKATGKHDHVMARSNYVYVARPHIVKFFAEIYAMVKAHNGDMLIMSHGCRGHVSVCIMWILSILQAADKWEEAMFLFNSIRISKEDIQSYWGKEQLKAGDVVPSKSMKLAKEAYVRYRCNGNKNLFDLHSFTVDDKLLAWTHEDRNLVMNIAPFFAPKLIDLPGNGEDCHLEHAINAIQKMKLFESRPQNMDLAMMKNVFDYRTQWQWISKDKELESLLNWLLIKGLPRQVVVRALGIFSNSYRKVRRKRLKLLKAAGQSANLEPKLIDERFPDSMTPFVNFVYALLIAIESIATRKYIMNKKKKLVCHVFHHDTKKLLVHYMKNDEQKRFDLSPSTINAIREDAMTSSTIKKSYGLLCPSDDPDNVIPSVFGRTPEERGGFADLFQKFGSCAK